MTYLLKSEYSFELKRRILLELVQIIQQNLATINQTIHQNQKTEPPTLIAVTKQVDADTMRELFNLGVHHFGENRTHVMLEKLAQLEEIKDEVTWHFIGHLQTRQVRDIINHIDYLHSLDRPSLAKEVNKRARQPVNCFVQVNVSGEASKSGFAPEEVLEFIEFVEKYPNIYVVGLMTMAPYEATEAELHTYFAELRQLQQDIAGRSYPFAPCQWLSMGMSRDYPIAIQEGADFVRIGTAIYQSEDA